MTLLADPADIQKITKEQLVELYAQTCELESEVKSQKRAISDELWERIKGSGEVVGEYSVNKITRRYFKAELEQAKELGATKEVVDKTALRKLYEKGADIEHSVSKYVRIQRIQEDE